MVGKKGGGTRPPPEELANLVEVLHDFLEDQHTGRQHGNATGDSSHGGETSRQGRLSGGNIVNGVSREAGTDEEEGGEDDVLLVHFFIFLSGPS